MILRALLASVIATVAYAGFMWMLGDLVPRALAIFFCIVLAFNLAWNAFKARQAGKQAKAPKPGEPE